MEYISKICIVCGEEFIKRKLCPLIKWKKQKFCSHSCYWKNRKGKRVSSKTEFKKGVTPWNKEMKGLKQWHNLEGLKSYVVKNGSAFKNKKHTEKAKKIIREKRAKQVNPSGQIHWNWKGGTSPLRKRIMSLGLYVGWRAKVFQRDNWICQNCGKQGGRLNVHHRNPFYKILEENQIKTVEQAKNCKELWDIVNGRTLCIPCHKQTPSYLVNQHTM